MNSRPELSVFLKPESVAVIGASEKPDSWGAFIMSGLRRADFKGRIHPVHPRAERIFGLPVLRDIRDVQGPVDLAVIMVPLDQLEDIIAACGHKGVKALAVISAGFAETHPAGLKAQNRLAGLARSLNMRMLGPNISGTFDLQARFNLLAIDASHLLATPIAAVSQGGYAFQDILVSAWYQKMGVAKFVHTGNEADLTITDFLEYFAHDPEIKAIAMYIEAIRDGKRFMEVAGRLKRTKPIVVYKAGKTAGSVRAAQSHTGAVSSPWQIYKGLFRQTGIVVSPSMELLLPIAHALIERPGMRGNRVAIITMGGSWGVALTDSLADCGLIVPEFSPSLQQRLRDLGLTMRASASNPVDFGASGRFVDTPFLLALTREILVSGEADALVLHGFGRAGMKKKEHDEEDFLIDIQKEQITSVAGLEKQIGLPVFIGNHHSQWESQTVHDLNQADIRIYSRLHDIAGILAGIYDYGRCGAPQVQSAD